MGRLKKIIHNHTYHTLMRYFLSYFTIISIFLLCFFLLVRNQLTTLYFNELSRQIDHQLENAAEQFSNSLSSVNPVNNSLISNTTLILSRHESSAWSKYLVYQEMGKYAKSNSLINCIIYYDKSRDMLLSTRQHAEYREGAFFIYNGADCTAFYPDEYMDIPYNQLIFLSGTASEYLVYFPYNASDAGYVVFYIIDSREIQNMLKSSVSGEIVSMALVSSGGQIAACPFGPLSQSGALPSPEKGIYRLDSQTSLLISSELYNSFHLAALISNELLLKQVDTAFRRTYLFLIFLGILGIFLIVVAMKSTFVPLHNLTKKIVKNPDPSMEYLEQLEHAFNESMEESQQLQDKITRYKSSMQKSILDSIVNNNRGAKPEDFCSIDSLFTAELDKHIFVLYMKALKPPFPAQDIGQYFSQSLPKDDSCIVLESGSGSATFLLSYSGMEQNKEEVIHMLISSICEEKGYLAALSNSSSSPLDIPFLYENAMQASCCWDRQPVVSYQTVAPALPRKASVSYPYRKLDDLARSFQYYDFCGARQIVRELFYQIESPFLTGNSLPNFFSHCLLIDMLTVIINSMTQANIKFKTYSSLYFETLYFCRSFPYEDKKREISENVEKLLLLFEEEYENKSINSARIQHLVKQHYTSPDFSISYLADLSHVSIAYMSYLFKKEIGENFLDYVWTMRLEKAKELLLTTDILIDDISTAIGYLNPSSFRRKFKQSVGLTPSQYRSRGTSG